MFGIYTDLVLQDYRQKKESNKLPIVLIHLKPAGLRDLCLEFYNKKFDRKKDELALYGFFGQHEDKAAMIKTIKHFDTSKFKPLINYLKKDTNKTEEKNIELLAWLIDFKDRPFELGKRYIAEEENNNEVTNSIADENVVTDTVSEEKKENPLPPTDKSTFGISNEPDTNSGSVKTQTSLLLKKISLYTGIFLLVIGGVYIYYNRAIDKPVVLGSTLKGPEACMYWADDHYEQVSCNEKKESLVIALDSFKLQHFKKITRPDTITQQHVGRVWYIKTADGIEFYTAEGMHPVDLQKRLKPATAYIIDKYILSLTD